MVARHEQLSPMQGGKIYFEVVPNERVQASDLFMVVETPRTYEMQVSGRYRMGGEHDAGRRPILGGYPERIFLEMLPPDRKAPETSEVHLRFWPSTDP